MTGPDPRDALMFARRTVLFGAAALFALPPRHALAGPAALTAQDRADLRRIEAYLNGLTTLEARFVQVTNGTDLVEGIFYLKRPGRMRLEYDPPIPYLYVADGNWLTFYDADLEQRSDAPLGSTIADFITREDVRLSGDVTVTGMRRGQNLISVSLVQTSDPEAGTMTLNFTAEPIMLQSWTVRDAQGVTTQVDLTGMIPGVELANSLFVAPRKGFGEGNGSRR
jgi:outer membrane lipoprotein-sorting protein